MNLSEQSAVPLVMKTSVTIAVIGQDTEAAALRAVLEGFNYRVDVIWVGSRAEFIEILKGTIETHKYLILSCHGTSEGIVVPNEKPVSAQEISEVTNLKDKVVLSLGCKTGTEQYQRAFIERGQVSSYIAPSDYPEGSSALIFGINLFYELSKKKTLEESYSRAIKTDEETSMFQLFKRN